MVPVDARSVGVDEVENVGPVAALPLKDVQLAPDQLLDRNAAETLAPHGDLRTAVKPVAVHLRPVIGHLPNRVHDHIALAGPVNPRSVVGEPIEVVLQSGPMNSLDHPRPVLRQNVAIEVLGVAKPAGIDSGREGSAEGELDASLAKLLHDPVVDAPFGLGNFFIPGGLYDRWQAHPSS